jgi:hypothetical protein
VNLYMAITASESPFLARFSRSMWILPLSSPPGFCTYFNSIFSLELSLACEQNEWMKPKKTKKPVTYIERHANSEI